MKVQGAGCRVQGAGASLKVQGAGAPVVLLLDVLGRAGVGPHRHAPLLQRHKHLVLGVKDKPVHQGDQV